MSSPFAEELRRRLDSLENLQLRSDHYDEQNFGNALVEFQAGGVLVRFVRDRGIVTVEVGVGDRFLSLDFLASEQGWVTRDAIEQHHQEEDLGQNLEIDGNEGDLYEALRQALEDEGEDQVACIKNLLEPANDGAAAGNQAAPRGPYYGLCLHTDDLKAPADAVAMLREHWREIVAAVTNETWFPDACDKEAAFWESIGM